MTATSSTSPWVLGYSISHNGAVCLLRGGELVVAIQEERVRGEKRARLGRLDESVALRYCLDYAGIGVEQLSAIVACAFSGESLKGSTIWSQGWKGKFLSIPHHLGHAWAAFAQSGFEDATILVVDGQGGSKHTLPDEELVNLKFADIPGQSAHHEIVSIYHADASGIRCVEKHIGQWIVAPEGLGKRANFSQFGSIGGMFSAASDYIFGNAMDAGKVMGLAAFGQANYPVDDFFTIDADGQFHFSPVLTQKLQALEPWPKNQAEHRDLAASVQAALEVAMTALVRRARLLGTSVNLCLVGGVALNNVANEQIVAMPEFERVFVMPAAEDSGPAIGAAYFGLHALGHKSAFSPIVQDAPGRPYSAVEVQEAAAQMPGIELARSTRVIDEAVELLLQGKVLGWFQGGSELGPRALGQRSIIADPRRADCKDRLNLQVKHREAFRPFAPAILEECVADWFVLPKKDPTSPFMLRTFAFHPEQAVRVPGAVHQDGSGRLQTLTAARNGRFHALVCAFAAQTGVPILVNTSFNVMGEPIVETPEDAMFSLLYTQLDAVVIDDFLVTRRPTFRSVLQLVPMLAARSITVQNLILQRRQEFSARVERYGLEFQVSLPETVMPMIELMDGKRSCQSIHQHLIATRGWPKETAFILQILRHLRRVGVIRFVGAEQSH